MIVFSRPPGWRPARRRSPDIVKRRIRPPAAVKRATLRAALQVLTLSSRGPCDAPSITADHAPGLRELARPSDVSPSYESKYSAPTAWLSNGRMPVGGWPLHRPRALQCLHATGDMRPDPANHYNLLL